MTFPHKKSQNFGFKFAALALCLWLSGATCAISCAAMDTRAMFAANANAHHKAVQAVVEESCSMRGRNCCHGKTEAAQDATEKGDGGTMFAVSTKPAPQFDCCGFVKITAERAQKVGHTDALFIGETAPVKLNSFNQKRRKLLFRASYQPLPLGRGDIYLRNCVFRI